MKSSGKIFENIIENIFLSSDKFSDSLFKKGFINVYNFKEYMNLQGNVDFNSAIQSEKNNTFLFKNVPNNNDLHEKTEFCLVRKINGNIIKGRIECKFQKVSGSTHKKIEHEIQQYRRNKCNSRESFFILIYDGKYYEDKKFIIDSVQKSIQYDFDILVLNLKEFKYFLNDYLSNESDTSNAFKVCSALTKPKS